MLFVFFPLSFPLLSPRCTVVSTFLHIIFSVICSYSRDVEIGKIKPIVSPSLVTTARWPEVWKSYNGAWLEVVQKYVRGNWRLCAMNDWHCQRKRFRICCQARSSSWWRFPSGLELLAYFTVREYDTILCICVNLMWKCPHNCSNNSNQYTESWTELLLSALPCVKCFAKHFLI